ncbi:hypothetical protein [Bifidobacterium sp.]|uniref:hypothetical protein n=1 Tax=Bifidobacterium sp. TaxID=41200 RepID=UPI0039E9A408
MLSLTLELGESSTVVRCVSPSFTVTVSDYMHDDDVHDDGGASAARLLFRDEQHHRIIIVEPPQGLDSQKLRERIAKISHVMRDDRNSARYSHVFEDEHDSGSVADVGGVIVAVLSRLGLLDALLCDDADFADCGNGGDSDSATNVADDIKVPGSASNRVRRPAAPAKARHRWSKEVSTIEFHVDYKGVRATVRWLARNQMLVLKGATMLDRAPLNKDGSLGFSARFAEQMRREHAAEFKSFKTTTDILLKSVNEVGLFLYFGGTNSWLVLKDDDGRSIHDWTVVS